MPFVVGVLMIRCNRQTVISAERDLVFPIIVAGADVTGVTLIHQILRMHAGSFEYFDEVFRSMIARGADVKQ